MGKNKHTYIKEYKTIEGGPTFKEMALKEGQSFTLIDDNWNATDIAMREAIKLLHSQSKFFSGEKIAILGRIENLGKKEAKRQHETLAELLIQSDINLVFTHGLEMKYLLRKLPETMIGGHFDCFEQLMESVVRVIEPGSLVLIKGSPKSSEFKYDNQYLKEKLNANKRKVVKAKKHPHATGVGAMTFDMANNHVVGMAGDKHVEQNQGLGNILLINEILNGLFAGEFRLSDTFRPSEQEVKENKSLNAIPLHLKQKLSLHTILSAALVRNAPNAILMLANQVIGNNKHALTTIRRQASLLNLPNETVLNITGRRIPRRMQTINLPHLYEVAKQLFDKFPKELALLSQPFFEYSKNIYRQKSNLFNDGSITHGIFYGYLDSVAITLSHVDSRKLITVVLGATDPFERDQLIKNSLENVKKGNKVSLTEHFPTFLKKEYKMNILGDTYFGEFYTNIRRKRGKQDALQKYDRNFSFNSIRPLLEEADFTICNFEAAVSESKEHPLAASKPFILYADSKETIPAFQRENIDLVTLGNNHLMDCGLEGLQLTLDQFNAANIETIGSGMNQMDAEKPYIQLVNGQRVAIFNGYWYRNLMYFNYDFYAIGNRPGVACLSGNIIRNIKKEKQNHPDGFIIVIPHWGADFKLVADKQREYAYALMDAGADVIIGHGAHMMQEIEKYNDKYIIYSIGNGVFNSNGEYNRRHVPPYSFIAQLIQQDKWQLRLYPIYTNNLKTFWQPTFVNEKQFFHCEKMLKMFGSTSLYNNVDADGRIFFQIDI